MRMGWLCYQGSVCPEQLDIWAHGSLAFGGSWHHEHWAGNNWGKSMGCSFYLRGHTWLQTGLARPGPWPCTPSPCTSRVQQATQKPWFLPELPGPQWPSSAGGAGPLCKAKNSSFTGRCVCVGGELEQRQLGLLPPAELSAGGAAALRALLGDPPHLPT